MTIERLKMGIAENGPKIVHMEDNDMYETYPSIASPTGLIFFVSKP
ncbi:hypothetical protein [Paenibacillus popilliae]|nr:hypothetical protein [Paenibacillus popilliae]